MEELMNFIDSHPEVKPLLTGEFLDLVAQTPGFAEVLIPCMENVSNVLREQLAERVQRRVEEE